MNTVKTFLLLIISSAFVLPSHAWTEGQEQEVDPGVYITLVQNIDGWSIWQKETKNGIECVATKPVKGVREPTPFKGFYVWTGGSPGVLLEHQEERTIGSLSLGSDGPKVSFIGEWYSVKTEEYRKPGDRFFEALRHSYPVKDNSEKIVSMDGQIIEIHVESWEYPDINVGLSDRTGEFDTTGIQSTYSAILN